MTTTNQSTQSPPAAGSGRLSTPQRIILAIVLIADVLDLMDSTITNIAAPAIARDIGGGESLIKWLGASYALAMGVLLVVGGRLGDRYGKRRMFLVGMAGFTLASVWCGLSVDPAMLIAGRLVQGSFGALLIPQGIGILLGALSREQLPRAFGVFGPVMGASAILGPIVAGFIISANIAGLTWRPIFLINIAAGSAGFVAALRLLPRDGQSSAVPIDGLGSGILGASMLSLIYGLIEGSTAGGPRCRSAAWPPAPCCSPPSGCASGRRPTRSSCPHCWPTGASPRACCSAWRSSRPSTAWPTSCRSSTRPPSGSRPPTPR